MQVNVLDIQNMVSFIQGLEVANIIKVVMLFIIFLSSFIKFINHAIKEYYQIREIVRKDKLNEAKTKLEMIKITSELEVTADLQTRRRQEEEQNTGGL
jgi:hypothetical protein